MLRDDDYLKQRLYELERMYLRGPHPDKDEELLHVIAFLLGVAQGLYATVYKSESKDEHSGD